MRTLPFGRPGVAKRVPGIELAKESTGYNFTAGPRPRAFNVRLHACRADSFPQATSGSGHFPRRFYRSRIAQWRTTWWRCFAQTASSRRGLHCPEHGRTTPLLHEFTTRFHVRGTCTTLWTNARKYRSGYVLSHVGLLLLCYRTFQLYRVLFRFRAHPTGW